MTGRTLVLSVKCEEGDKVVERNVYRSKLSIRKLRTFYQNLQQFDVLFNDYVENDLDSFIQSFIDITGNGQIRSKGIVWEVDDVGILFLTDIRPPVQALSHFSFWDRRIKGREELMQKMALRVFNKYGIHRLVSEIPFYAQPAMAAVERIGFKNEGRKREAVKYKGDWWDVNLYSLLKSDLEGKENGTES